MQVLVFVSYTKYVVIYLIFNFITKDKKYEPRAIEFFSGVQRCLRLFQLFITQF